MRGNFEAKVVLLRGREKGIMLITMQNWSVDENYMKKFPRQYELWKLEQQLAYGIEEDEKIDKKKVIANWGFLKNRLDADTRHFIEFSIWNQF
jgi:hypothetical protein